MTIPAPKATPYPTTTNNEIEFNWFAVDDDNGNPYNEIFYNNEIWKLSSCNSSMMTVTYKKQELTK